MTDAKTGEMPPAVKAAAPVVVKSSPKKPALAAVAPPRARAATAPKSVAKPAPAAAMIPAAASISAIPASTTPATKETKMTITTDQITGKARAMFSGLNDQTKGAMEKSTHMFEEMNAFGKGNIEAMVESSKIAAKAIETLGQDAADRTKKSFEGMTEAFKTFAAAKSPTEFMKLQSDYARTAFDTLVAESSRSTEMMMKLVGEITQPISNRVAIATEKMKISA